MARQATKSARKRPASVLAILSQHGLPKDFALSPHLPSKRWYKVIRKKRHYFGDLDHPQAALDLYLDQKDDLLAGRKPREQREGGVDVAFVVNSYLNAAKRRLDAGEIKLSTFDAYRRVGAEVVKVLGRTRAVSDLRHDDFGHLRATFAKRFGPAELSKRVQTVRSVFKYAYDAELIDKPQRFGPEFAKPSRAVLRRHRNKQPRRMFEAEDIRQMIEHATPPLKAMILLGINCGWGNSDIAELPLLALDLDSAHADYPRPKTGIEREATLWPETIEALRKAIEKRPTPKHDADAGVVFITKYGKRWVRYRGERDDGKGGAWSDGVRLQFNKLLKELDLHEPGVSFYALRHTFQTIAEGAGDMPAVGRIMGHADDSMASRYRERIDEQRLKAVTDYVHTWVWPEPAT